MTVAAADPVDDLARRARRAYERGRLRWAVSRALAAVAVAAVALIGCAAPGSSAACAAALGVLIASCLWRGGAWAGGARLGFLAGLTPCLLPAAFRTVLACGGTLCLTLLPLCVLAGVVAGLLLGWLGLRAGTAHDRRFWLAAAGATLLAGSTGCLAAGFAGLGGMVLGMLAGAAAPALAARTA
jgi:hypothetical protein